MNASDFQTNTSRLTGRTGLFGSLSWARALTHWFGPPRLSVCFFPTCRPRQPRRSLQAPAIICLQASAFTCNPEARRLRLYKLTRLIRCGSSSFRPIGSLPACSPSSLATGQAPVGFVVNRLTRRVRLTLTLNTPFTGCCELPVYRMPRQTPPFLLFFSGAP